MAISIARRRRPHVDLSNSESVLVAAAEAMPGATNDANTKAAHQALSDSMRVRPAWLSPRA
jgi:hypothetical protein